MKCTKCGSENCKPTLLLNKDFSPFEWDEYLQNETASIFKAFKKDSNRASIPGYECKDCGNKFVSK